MEEKERDRQKEIYRGRERERNTETEKKTEGVIERDEHREKRHTDINRKKTGILE